LAPTLRWYRVRVCLVAGISLAAAFMVWLLDTHWFFLDHQLALLATSLSAQIALLITSWSHASCNWLARTPHGYTWRLLLKKSLLLFVVSLGCLSALAGSSSLRFEITTIGAKDGRKAALVIYFAMALTICLRHVLRYLWTSINHVPTAMAGEVLVHVRQHGLFQARYRDATLFGTDFVICFTSRLLKAALPHWKFALASSLAENVCEVGSLWWSFETEVRKLSQAEERRRLAGSDSSDGAMLPSPEKL